MIQSIKVKLQLICVYIVAFCFYFYIEYCFFLAIGPEFKTTSAISDACVEDEGVVDVVYTRPDNGMAEHLAFVGVLPNTGCGKNDRPQK